MLLYLSSQGLGGDPSALAAPRAGARAGLVLNALDGYPDRQRNWDRERDDLAGLGYAAEELDLRDSWSSPAGELASRLARLDLVWVVGGNVFVLARAMALAGFGAALADAAARGDLRYGGYSAGSCVAGPDLTGIEAMDEPDLVPPGYPATGVPAACLGLVPFRIVPHVVEANEESAGAAVAVSRLREAGLEFRALRDGEALVVRDGEVTLAGAP